MMSRRSLIIALITLAVITIAVIGFVLQRSNQQTSTTYTDPGSGEKIVNTGQSQQGSDLSLKNSIVFLGFSNLLDRGLSPTQVQSVQSTLRSYSLTLPTPIKEASLTIDSMRHILPVGDSAEQSLEFTITTNRTDHYFMRVTYSDTTSCDSVIYSADKSTRLFPQA